MANGRVTAVELASMLRDHNERMTERLDSLEAQTRELSERHREIHTEAKAHRASVSEKLDELTVQIKSLAARVKPLDDARATGRVVTAVAKTIAAIGAAGAAIVAGWHWLTPR